MAYKNKILSTTGGLQLIKSVSKQGNTKYLIKLMYNTLAFGRLHELRRLCDPGKNRAVRSGGCHMWKFNTLHEANEILTVAVLKGLAHGK
jgi:hypothetical protein